MHTHAESVVYIFMQSVYTHKYDMKVKGELPERRKEIDRRKMTGKNGVRTC